MDLRLIGLRRSFFAALPAFGLLGMAPALHAQVTSVPLFENHLLRQTGPSALADVGYEFNTRIFETNPGDVTSATLTYPGPGSPASYSQASYSPTILQYDSGILPSLAALNSAYPGGTYTTQYNTSGGSGTVTETLPASPAFSNVPMFDAATYNGLQGLNAAQSFTASFDALAPDAAVTNQFVFLDIYNSATGAAVFQDNFASPSTTSATIAANTFQAGTSYFGVLLFDNRTEGTSNGIGTTVAFDQRTLVNFTTAPVPEASTTVSFGLLLCLGLGGMIVARKKAQAQV